MSETVYHDEYHPHALDEFEEVTEHYDAISPGLGYTFFQAVNECVENLLDFPESCPVVHPSGARRKVLGRFPYNIIYWLSDETLTIIAIAHQRRRPDYWVYRLKS